MTTTQVYTLWNYEMIDNIFNSMMANTGSCIVIMRRGVIHPCGRTKILRRRSLLNNGADRIYMRQCLYATIDYGYPAVIMFKCIPLN
jgi:hypothetical protein